MARVLRVLLASWKAQILPPHQQIAFDILKEPVEITSVVANGRNGVRGPRRWLYDCGVLALLDRMSRCSGPRATLVPLNCSSLFNGLAAMVLCCRSSLPTPAGGTCVMPKLKPYVGLDVLLEEDRSQ